jgi:glycosyltransferase involved in cell wall biosynthesis
MGKLTGTGVQVKNLSQALQVSGHEVRVVTMLTPHPDLELSAAILNQPLERDLPTPATRFAHLLREAVDGCSKFPPDIVHAHYPHGMLVANTLRAFTGIPYVITVHGYELYAPRSSWKFRVMKKALSEANAVISVSARVMADARAYFGIENGDWAMVPDSFDESRFRPAPRESHSGLNIVSVSRMVPEKGLPTLIRAFAKVRHPGARLILVGDGSQEPELRSEVARLGVSDAVTFTGYRKPSEVAGILASADIFVIPSLEEGLGTRMLEAMGTGLPIIGTDVGGIPEALEHGDAGIVVEPGSEVALAQAMETLIQNARLRAHLGAASLRVSQRYSRRAVGERAAGLYEGVRHGWL